MLEIQPQRLWAWFCRICAIPHATHEEQALCDYLYEWANSEGLKASKDSAGNLLISKNATTGRETRKTIAIQAHLDMVPQKEAESTHNFSKDPITAIRDGDWVRAAGTTLGADNGIGVATILSILESSDISHGPIEAVLTVGEERGMRGARALQPSWISARILLNLDAEEEGALFVGCSGGQIATVELSLETEALAGQQECFKIQVGGLKGGHSGLDIHHVRGNALKIVTALFRETDLGRQCRIAHICGGTSRNAIPRDAQVIVIVPGETSQDFIAAADVCFEEIMSSYADSESGLRFTLTNSENPNIAYSRDCQDRVLSALASCPNGVARVSSVYSDTTESSCNLGVLKQVGDKLIAEVLVRSITESGRVELHAEIFNALATAWTAVSFSDPLPAWTPVDASPITKIVETCHERLFKLHPHIKVIHAGLECGAIKVKYPDMDIVSFGPTILNAHSPSECVNIASVHRFWRLVLATLEDSP